MTFSLSLRTRRAALLCASFVFLSLGGCGGGDSSSGGSGPVAPGPGGSGPAAPVFAVSIDRSALRFEAEQGSVMQPLAVLGSGAGPAPAAIYTGALDLGTDLERITAEVVGMQIKFSVYPKTGLPAGEYRGSVQFFACPDAKCAQQFAGSPVDVPYTITIRPIMQLAPVSMSLSALSGAVASGDIAVQLPQGQSSFTVSTSAGWMSATNVTPTGFKLTTLPMPPGIYNGSVSVTTSAKSMSLPVSYTVLSDATTVLWITPEVNSVNFSATASTAAPARAIKVTLPSWTTELEATVTYSDSTQGWLSASKTSANQITLLATAANLRAGNYTAQVTLKAGNMATPVTVPVSFSVDAPSWKLNGNINFEVGGATTASQLASAIQIDAPNLPSQSWSASTSSPWLKLINSSGNTGTTKLQVAVDSAEMMKLANFGSYTADVAITTPGGKIAPTTLSFTLNKHLAQIDFISPHTRLPGEAGTLIVRGRGFNSVSDLQKSLGTSGAAVSAITPVNDTQLLVQVAGAAQGETTFTMNNALGVATGTARLAVVPQASFTYRAIATAGNKGSLHFDPERQSIYTANKSIGSLMRFAFDKGNWNVTATSIPSIDSSAMAPDGKSVVTTSTNKQLNLLDPSSLAIQSSYTAAYIGGDTLNSLPRLAVTNNGKAFFQGDTWDSGMAYFDLATRKFGALESRNVRLDFYSGPWFSVSGDGDRLLIVQSASISPSPLMLYMDASDESPKPNPAGLTFWYEAAQSLHGERFIEGTYKVWDRDFNLIGNVVFPDTGNNAYYGKSPVFSPDGKQVYILSYPDTTNSTSSAKPRVYVFDTSTKLVTTTSLPVLGYFELNDYPTCNDLRYECNTRALATISPDGKTLFFIGDTNLIIAPIPALQKVAASAPIQRARAGSKLVPDTMVLHELKQR